MRRQKLRGGRYARTMIRMVYINRRGKGRIIYLAKDLEQLALL